jgi:RNA polymerase sigma-70 factor, ECF subfamily
LQLPVSFRGDEELITAIADKSNSAMRTLYARHSLTVFRFLLRLTKDETLAEDLVSNVFIAAWKSASSFRANSKVSTWLLGIARHEAWSALRQRREMQLDGNLVSTIEDSADDPETAFDKKDRAESLRECFKTLSAAHREVIDLIYYHEKSINEVAEILGIPPGTVKTRAFHARSQIADMLKKHGIEHAVS